MGKPQRARAKKDRTTKQARKRKARGPSGARSSDKHVLYQRAVQDAEHDVEFLQEVYRAENGRRARHMREDFCGTALLCAEWVRQGPDFSAEGFDLHQPTLDWGREHNLASLGEDADRVTLHAKDVRAKSDHPVDVCNAQNFSYQVFHTRQEMLEYFGAAYRDLADDGIFVFDMYGGWESTEDMEEERNIGDGVTYVWDQVTYSPVTARQKCAIHFRFKDGSELRNAFVYDWRKWEMRELEEILLEVGFERVDAYFEKLDEDGDGTGVFERTEEGINCESWLAYLVAIK